MADESRVAESATTPAGGAPPETDELARDLPGLPLEFEYYCVAESGFYLKPRVACSEGVIPWSQVTGFTEPFWSNSEVETIAPDSCDVRRVVIAATREQLDLPRGALREYVTRAVARDGLLKGSHRTRVSDMRHCPRALLVATLAVGAILCLVCGWDIENVGFTLASGALAAVYAALAAIAAVAGVTARRSVHASLMHWYRWELRRDGLSFWPSGEKRCLKPSSEDAAGPDSASIAGVRVPVSHLTRRDALGALLAQVRHMNGNLGDFRGSAGRIRPRGADSQASGSADPS